MKILGICESPRKNETCGVYTLAEAVPDYPGVKDVELPPHLKTFITSDSVVFLFAEAKWR